MEIIPGDNHYLGISGIVTAVLQLSCFFIAYSLGFDKITDFSGSTNFILLALLSLCGAGGYSPRAIMLTAMVLVCRLELAVYLLQRVLRRGKDDRFDNVRGHFFSFLVFWILQMIWVWGVCLPVVFVNSETIAPAQDARDWAGLAMFVVGFVVQVAADAQKDVFRANPANKGRCCSAGVWAYSRHPNFFGEILLWWGVWTACTPVFSAPGVSAWGWATVVSPVLTMVILLFGSGMPTAEGDFQRRFMRTPEDKAAYIRYRNRTSPVLPLPPVLYAALPRVVKQVLLLELPLYETDWSYEGWRSAPGAVTDGGAVPPAAFPPGSPGEGVAIKLRESLVSSGAYQTA